MLENIFVLLMIMSFIIFVIAIEKESWALSVMSAILWIVIFAQAFYIEVPGDTAYVDYTINIVSLVFIFVNIILAIAYFMGYSLNKRYRIV